MAQNARIQGMLVILLTVVVATVSPPAFVQEKAAGRSQRSEQLRAGCRVRRIGARPTRRHS